MSVMTLEDVINETTKGAHHTEDYSYLNKNGNYILFSGRNSSKMSVLVDKNGQWAKFYTSPTGDYMILSVPDGNIISTNITLFAIKTYFCDFAKSCWGSVLALAEPDGS